ncbi:MAG TPA: LpqB family beta-propeller domain-containing protein [Solirubrobacteraceae bacterium]|nr:LpqB family beta-propeller domain-containing protein [Solirubrobacteraceae bacterium]
MAGRWRSLGAVAITAVAAVGAASSAQARLVYERGFRTSHPTIWIARDDGTHARRLAAGSSPMISPDGRLVAYRSTSSSARERLMLIAAGGGPPRVLLSAPILLAVSWSPNSRHIAAIEQTRVTRTTRQTERTVVIDVRSGAIRPVSRASLPYSVSFSPHGTELAYTWSPSANPIRDDIYRVAASGGRAVRLTFDGQSMMPLWGRDWIVFVRQSPATASDPIPKQNLYLVRPNGTGRHRLTHAAIGLHMFGFTPVDWSASGRRLIAEFAGPGISYVVTVDVRTGAVRRVGSTTSGGVVRGAALSRDGTTILGVQDRAGGVESVVTLPYGGGRVHVLARDAVGPSWSR